MKLCPPAFIFAVYIMIQIVLDFVFGNYNISLAKLALSLLYVIFLNFLCSIGLYVVAWLFVFIPFVLLSLAVTMLLYSLKLKETSGKTTTDDEDIPIPIVILPNHKIIQPLNNKCILVTDIVPPKHGMRGESKTKMYCM
jgi:uncharacterized membrane protein